MPEVLSNAHINALKVDLGRVEARLEQESAVLGPNHPQYLRTAAEVQGLREKLQVRDQEAGRRPGQRGASRAASARRELKAAIEAQNQRLLDDEGLPHRAWRR